MRIFYVDGIINTIAGERILSERKKKIEAELNRVTEHIKYYEDYCFHIVVNLGSDKYRCLLCNKVMDKSCCDLSDTINAENYLPQYNMENEEECNYKYELIRDFAYDLLRRKRDITYNDFVLELNSFIQENKSLEDSQEPKKLERKI